MSRMGWGPAQRSFLVIAIRGLAGGEDGGFHGSIVICRFTPLSTSAMKRKPRASSDSVTRTRNSGGVAAVAAPAVSTPALRNSSRNRLRKLDQSTPGINVRLCKSSETVARRGSREEVRAASCTAIKAIGDSGVWAAICAGNSHTEPNNRASVTRIIDYIMGHIILLARH